MTTTPSTQSRRHPNAFREDRTMFHIELRLHEAHGRQERLRAERHRGRPGWLPNRPFRHRLGGLLMQLARRVGGEAMSTPAWQG
jgi:hypothetical protein